MGKRTLRRKGGKLLGQGNNTCVYDPPVKCAGVAIPPNTVSRIVPNESVDAVKQDAVREAVKTIPEFKDNFNFYVSKCDNPSFSAEDLEVPCDVGALKGKINPGSASVQNLYTPKQDGDINKGVYDENGDLESNTLIKDEKRTIASLQAFLHAVVGLNSLDVQVFHADAHIGNISWVGDNIVLHDWEKATISDTQFWKSLSNADDNGWGGIIGTAKAIREASDTGDTNGELIARDLLYDAERWQDLTEFLQWRDALILLHSTDVSDRYAAGKELPISVAAAFRCWDLFSIIPVLAQMFAYTPLDDHPIYLKIRSNARIYWREIREALEKPIPNRDEFLKSITVRLHTIIDEAYATSGASRTRRRSGRSYRQRSTRRLASNTRKPSSRRNSSYPPKKSSP